MRSGVTATWSFLLGHLVLLSVALSTIAQVAASVTTSARADGMSTAIISRHNISSVGAVEAAGDPMLMGGTGSGSGSRSSSSWLLTHNRRLQMVGGKDANVTTYPFLTSLRDPSGCHYCWGALLAPSVVLAPAVCLLRRPIEESGGGGGSREFLPRYPEVHIGRYFTFAPDTKNISNRDNSSGTQLPSYEVRKCLQIIPHPNFNFISRRDNVALCVLDRSTSRSVGQLAPPAGESQLGSKTPLLVAAFGAKSLAPEDAGGSNVLQEAVLYLWNRTACNITYGGNISNNQICVRGRVKHSKRSAGVCSTDVGAPLLIMPRVRMMTSISAVVATGELTSVDTTQPGSTPVYGTSDSASVKVAVQSQHQQRILLADSSAPPPLLLGDSRGRISGIGSKGAILPPPSSFSGSDEHLLMGILSYTGLGCDWPGVFTDLTKYRLWIDEQLQMIEEQWPGTDPCVVATQQSIEQPKQQQAQEQQLVDHRFPPPRAAADFVADIRGADVFSGDATAASDDQDGEDNNAGGSPYRSSNSGRPLDLQEQQQQQQHAEQQPKQSLDYSDDLRVVGGQNPTNTSRYRFIASLRTTNGCHFCGGSLIAPKVVVTAAHCLQDIRDGLVPYPAVHIGRYFTNEDDGNGFDVRRCVRVILHPAWSETDIRNDIALCLLDQAATRPTIKLAPGALNLSRTTPLLLAGFGTKQNGEGNSDTLQEAVVFILNSTVCNQTYGGIMGARQICAGRVQGGVDSCRGDSGGPLLLPAGTSPSVLMEPEGLDRVLDSDRLLGLVSFGGLICARRGVPGVYTDVTKYRDWIEMELRVNNLPKLQIGAQISVAAVSKVINELHICSTKLSHNDLKEIAAKASEGARLSELLKLYGCAPRTSTPPLSR